MAACFALTFQSVELDDGMVEYMTFIRGILLVAIQMHVRGARLLFRNLLNSEQTEMLRPALEPLSPIERRWGEVAVAAVQGLGPLCRGNDMAASYQTLVLQMARALLVSPVECEFCSCASLPLSASLCLSLPLSVSPRLSPSLSVSLCLSLPL